MKIKSNVGILIFDDVEILDFAGPFEVFSRVRTIPGIESRWNEDSAPYSVFTIGKKNKTITAIGGLKILPEYTFDSFPKIDILVVPGGFGARVLLDDKPTINWIKEIAEFSSKICSVCTGSLVLAKAGLLKNRRATSHWGALHLLNEIDPTIEVDQDKRFVDDDLVTSAGVSAGIDMAFYIVEQTCGIEVANETAHFIDYPRI